MYDKGTVKITTKPCPNAEPGVRCCEDIHAVPDSRDGGYVEGAYLPHSCDEWVIGGKKQIEALIADLSEILKDAG